MSHSFMGPTRNGTVKVSPPVMDLTGYNMEQTHCVSNSSDSDVSIALWKYWVETSISAL